MWLLERTENPCVPGSIPGLGTKNIKPSQHFCCEGFFSGQSLVFVQKNNFLKFKENIISPEICKKCAECCKNHPFVELSKSEIDSLERLAGLPFDDFVNRKGEAVEEYFLKFTENGDCFFLKKKDGSYSCTVYEARPAICKNYPSRPRQKEACEANQKKTLSKFS